MKPFSFGLVFFFLTCSPFQLARSSIDQLSQERKETLEVSLKRLLDTSYAVLLGLLLENS